MFIPLVALVALEEPDAKKSSPGVCCPQQCLYSDRGAHARNREQNFALNLLLDADINLATLLGAAAALFNKRIKPRSL